MGKIKRMMAACISLVFSAAAMLSFSACKKPPEPKEKIDFRWSMSALTTAIERSYAKATGRKSEAVLDSSALNGMVASVDYEQVQQIGLPFYCRSLYSVEIAEIHEFYVEGSFDDVISEYCGSGPYRVLIAKYDLIIRHLYVVYSPEEGFVEDYFSTSGKWGDGYYIIVEGAEKQLLCSISTGDEEMDSAYRIIFNPKGYALGLEWENSYLLIPPYSEIRLTYDGAWSFACVYYEGTFQNEEEIYRHEYSIRRDSVKTYELNDEYLVTDLVVPIWYNHGDYVEHPAG